jgi:hypothetical protein
MYFQKRRYGFLLARSSRFVLAISFLFGCSSESEVTAYEFNFPKHLITLGHKGSGTFQEYGNTFRDNSVSGILHSLEELDGAEFDIQMSLDSTLWLFHDHDMLDCQGELVNIASMTDSSIEVNSACNYSAEVARFTDLVKALENVKHQSKTLSLDLKVLQNPESIKTFGGEAELAMFIAEKINTLTSTMTSYDLFIEVPFSSQVHIMESITGRTTFLIHNSFEYLRESLRMNHSSPIHHYYEDVPSLFHDYGQQSLLWVVNSADEMMNALALNPTAIQTDNIPMVQFFKLLNQGGQASAAVIQPPLDSISDFLVLEEQLQPITQDCLYEVDFGANRLDGVQLVISAVDNLGESTKWISIPIYKKNHFMFLGGKEHQLLGTQQYKIYLWHPEGKQIELKTQIKLSKVTLVQQ